MTSVFGVLGRQVLIRGQRGLDFTLQPRPRPHARSLALPARARRARGPVGLALGGNARTGMEDTRMLRRGTPVTSNAELVRRLVGVSRALKREAAEVTETEQRLSLPGG